MPRLTTLFAAALITSCIAAQARAQQVLHPGFKVEQLFAPPEIEHPSVVTCDDAGNLFIGEDPMDMRGPTTKEFDRIIYVVFDKDGKVARKTVFAENLSAVFGMIWHRGALYVMHAPHYTMFKDTDGDGVADVRKELADGFGPPAGVYGFNDHIVTGTRLGMDGYVYVSVGDKGIQKATGSDGSTINHEGGGVVRMHLDGSHLENFSTGTRNHLDVAMDSLDNVFTYDNTDDGLGWWTRFTHHIPTGYYGYPYDYHPHPERHLPRISEHGGGSPVGAACYRDFVWPEKYRDAALHCEWGKGRVQIFHTKRTGATFEATIDDFMVGDGKNDFRPLDLCFSPDGRHMYLADWNFGGWTNPKVAGRVFRVTYVGDDAGSNVPDNLTASVPTIDSSTPLTDVVNALPSQHQRVRMVAEFELAARGRDAVVPVTAVLRDKAWPTIGRVHALWALYHLDSALDNYDAAGDLVYALHNGPDDLRAQAARALGTRPYKGDDIVKNLYRRMQRDDDAQVRMYCAVALGRIGDPQAAGPLFDSLADDDIYARFAKIQALRALNYWSIAPGYINSADPRVREATVLTLTGVYADDAVAALALASRSAQDAKLRAEAVEALSEVPRKADPYVKGWWGTRPAAGKPSRPKVHEWSGTHAVLAALREALSDPDPTVRAAAIAAQQDVKDPAALAQVRQLLTTSSDAAVKTKIIQTLIALGDKASFDVLKSLALDAGGSAALRKEATSACVAINRGAAGGVVAQLAQDDKAPPEVVAFAIDTLGQLGAKDQMKTVAERIAHSDVGVRAAAVRAYGALAGASASAALRPVLHDPDASVRIAALQTLSSVGAHDAVGDMIGASADPAVRQAAALALATMPDRQALGVYLEGLTDKSPDVRAASGKAITTIRDQITGDLLALHKGNELRGDTRRELAGLFAKPAPVQQWKLLGAWPKDGKQPTFDTSAAPKLDEPVTIGDRSLRWQNVTSNHPQGMVNPGSYVKPDSACWAIAYVAHTVDQPSTVSWSLGSDDQAILWINGQKVYQFDNDRGWNADQAKGNVMLKAGVNHIWLQSGNSGGPWQFSLAIGGPDATLAYLYQDAPPQLDLAAFRAHAMKEKGDPARGKKVFFDPQGVGCVKCHLIGTEGTVAAPGIGPNLLGVGGKYPREELIRSVLEPSNRIASGYELNFVETDDGQTLQGLLRSDADDAIELIDATGKVTRIARKSIVERRNSPLSMMPNGLEKGMTLADFADLVAYLESLKEAK